MKYLGKSFSSPANSAEYVKNWDAVFGEPEPRIYPCAKCDTMRTKSEGGTTFTVCDACWDAAKPPSP
jgi:hypothetical protein